MFYVHAATTNLALGKPTSQSSIVCGTSCTGNASLAVDGNFEDNFAHVSCAITLKEITPWWAVDLQLNIQIELVVLTNRLIHDGGQRK